MKKIVFISDTHEQHEKVKVPPCDILLHAGDLTYRGKEEKVDQALRWLNKQDAKHVVVIAGNHDWLFQTEPEVAKELLAAFPKIHYLENNGVTLEGLKFWGSPWTPAFCNWAFNADPADIFKHWDLIPSGLDVLVTHGPPKGILDRAAPQLVPPTPELGCYDLKIAVIQTKPKIHVFGHIHGGANLQQRLYKDGTEFINASVVDEAYKVVRNPVEIDFYES